MRWVGLVCAALGAMVLGATTIGDRTGDAGRSPVIGGIVNVVGLLLLAGGGRGD